MTTHLPTWRFFYVILIRFCNTSRRPPEIFDFFTLPTRQFEGVVLCDVLFNGNHLFLCNKLVFQVREFLDSALLYADRIAIAVGPSPPLTTTTSTTTTTTGDDHNQQHQQEQEQQEELSLLQLISRVAREAEKEALPPPPPPPPPRSGETEEEEGGDRKDGHQEEEEEESKAGEAEKKGTAEIAAAEVTGAAASAAGVVSVFEVTPWGKFTPALNALLGYAARDGAELVMFQVRINENIVS